MKKFDIELAKQGAEVVTRDGNPVNIVYTNRKNEGSIKTPILGFELIDGNPNYRSWTKEGLNYKNGKRNEQKDLFMKPTHHEIWAIFDDDRCEMIPSMFSTSEYAKFHAAKINLRNHIIIKIKEWDE